MSNIITSLDNNVKFPVVVSLPATLNEGTFCIFEDQIYVGDSGNLPVLAGDVAGDTVSATAKSTPIDADLIPLVDSSDSNLLKKLSWANLKATLKTYFDGLYYTFIGSEDDTSSAVISAPAGKTGFFSFTGGGTGVGSEFYVNTAYNTTVPATGYYEYIAILSQSGTSAPVATVIKNTFDDLPVWSRVTNGTYLATLGGAFILNKTVCTFDNSCMFESASDIYNFQSFSGSTDTVTVYSGKAELSPPDFALFDDLIGNYIPTILTIRV